jgi:hypothetical protein
VTYPASPTTTSQIKARFSYGETPTLADYTSWTSDVSGYASLPVLEVRGLKNTGALDDGLITIEVKAGNALFDRLAEGARHAVVNLHLAEVVTAYGPSAANTATMLYAIGDYRLVYAWKNPDKRYGFVRMQFAGLKKRLGIPLGIAATPACAWTLGDKTCGVTVVTETATITAIDRARFTIGISDLAVVTAKPSGDAPYWHRGVVTLDSFSIGIREWIDGQYTFELIDNVPPWWLGATVTLRPSCVKTPGDCDGKWGNLEFFGGFGIKILSYNPLYEVTG